MRKHLGKHFELFIATAIALIAVTVLHFVPIDSRTGYVHNPWCLTQPSSMTYNYHWVGGDLNRWDNQLSLVKPTNSDCKLDQVVKLRLYAF